MRDYRLYLKDILAAIESIESFTEGLDYQAFRVDDKTGSDQAKFWLDPIGLASNYGFRAHELNEIERIIEQHQTKLIGAWNEHLGQE
jgi:hypothetical protein